MQNNRHSRRRNAALVFVLGFVLLATGTPRTAQGQMPPTDPVTPGEFTPGPELTGPYPDEVPPGDITPGPELTGLYSDGDGDGIDDALEQMLAERYAPVLFMANTEPNYPVNVDWILQRNRLAYREDGCTPDKKFEVIAPIGTQQQLVGPPWVYPSSFVGPPPLSWCDSDNARAISTTEQTPDGRTGEFGDEQTWYVPDTPVSGYPNYNLGSLDTTSWVTYFHAYPTSDGGMMIQYWHDFAYNEFGLGLDNHGGDWDASIQVQLNVALVPDGVWFSRHNDDHPGTLMDNNHVTWYQQTHPMMTIDSGGHAAFAGPDDWCSDTHESAGARTGWIVWGAPDNPSGLMGVNHDIIYGCEFLGQPGGTVWQTWTGGIVRQAGSFIVNPLYPHNPGDHGGLINLGEYNPGQGASPNVRQASHLLEGEFHPLNNQIFIKYSGRWGDTNNLASNGPRGPVFQGFDRDTGVYTSWYNQGSDEPANPVTSPWRVPPTTTLAVDGPSYMASGTIYVAGPSVFRLSAQQNLIADVNGSPQTIYGVQNGDLVAYTGPFVLSGGDSTYALRYFSVDALHNQEATQSRMAVLDNTPPTVIVSQPIDAQYPNSAMLTLNYAVGDGGGSGVSSFTARMDGQSTVGGHGLASGQAINLLTEMSVGTHTLTIDASDHLGNTASSSVTFEVVLGGDLDGDGDVDMNDLNLLLKDRDKTVSNSLCGILCDLDGDGKITALDARKLTLLCTRPRCATG